MNRSSLKTRILDFIHSDGASEPFESLALDTHRWQRTHAPVIEALSTSEVSTWTQIPAVPVSLFKSLPVGTLRQGESYVTFRTSGTTGGGQGVHRLRDTDLYDAGSIQHYRSCVPDSPSTIVALLSDPTTHPDSSLSHMVALFSSNVRWTFHEGLDRSALNAAIATSTQPLFVPSTAFALAEWLQGPVEALPEGSVLMVTGGFKGRNVEFSDSELYGEARRKLAPHRLVTEYGMTELSSQLWGEPGQPYRPPAWMRVLSVDPETGRPLHSGSPGQLRFIDLANLDSTLAIDTLDCGWIDEDGGVHLQGRLQGAPARGCSLTVEEAWGRP